jgi:hypothetical protein
MSKYLHISFLHRIFALLIKKNELPHQSRLGNSSNFIEMPRQAFILMAGPTSKEVFFGNRRITKEWESSNPDYRSFIALFGVAFL